MAFVADISAKEWGRKQRRPFVKFKATGGEIHHTGEPNSVYSLLPATEIAQRIQRYHYNSLRWNSVFYQFGAGGTDNKLVEMRGEGNLSSRKVGNRETLVLFGNSEIADPTAFQRQVVIDFIERHDGDVTLHKDRYAGVCPGSKFSAMIIDERDRYNLRKNNIVDYVNELLPAIHPPWAFEGIVDTMSCPHGGAWMLKYDGAIYAVGGAPYLGGANDKDYWFNLSPGQKPRHAVRLEPAGDGYSIVSQYGERYQYLP